MNKDIVGRGWHFPIQLDTNRHIELTTYENEIEQSIHIILSTMPGERVMRPEFGSRLHELVFEPLNNETIVNVRRFVIDALERWEPRIAITKVEIITEPGNRIPSSEGRVGYLDGCLLILLEYEIKKTHDQRSLVYPFYLIPGE